MHSRGTILVVDGDTGLLKLLRELLTEGRYSVETATRGGDAITLARGRRPDVVLLAMNLPDAGGAAILQQLHALDRTLPVVVLGRDADASARELLRTGAFDYLAEPFRYEQLRAVVAGAIAAGRSRARRGVVVPFDAYRRARARSAMDRPRACIGCGEDVADTQGVTRARGGVYHAACWPKAPDQA